MMPISEIQVGVRMPVWLKEDVEESAKRSGWSFSAQVRYELMERRGKAFTPYLPQPALSFSGPTQGTPARKSHRRRTGA